MPSLHAELAGETRAGACKVCTYLFTLEPAARLEWQAELALPKETISHASVVTALKRRNVSIEEASVRRHRINHVAR